MSYIKRNKSFSLSIVAILVSLLATITGTGQEYISFTSNSGGNNNIWRMKSDGSGQIPLTSNPASDSYSNISSDGSKIVFISDRDGNPEIYVMNAAGLFQTRLTNNPATESEPVFSPDGTKIVFSSNRDGNYEIYIMNADGSGQTRLTTNTVDDGQAEFSPDGTKIIFSRLAANQSDSHIYTMDLNGANQVALTTGSFVLNGYPSYSPDAQTIVFSSVRPLTHTDAEIYTMNANGTGQTRRTTASGNDLEPVFNPSGTKIAFRSERDGNAEIYVMNNDATSQTRLTFGGAGVTNFAPSWSLISTLNIDIPDDLATSTGATLTVPITVSNTTGLGILSYDLTVTYDPQLLQPQIPAFDKTGTLSSGFEINSGISTPGNLVVSAYGTAPLTGAGTLLNLKFNVIGVAPAFANLGFLAFRFNEGVPLVDASGGQAFISGTVSGRVSYGTAPATLGVPGVSLQAAGTPNTSTVTAVDGTYLLQAFGPGAYVVTPSKVGDVNGITALDASLISQFLVGATSLTANQQIAADVTEAGGISSFDAAMIAQYVVGLQNTANVGLWRFAPPFRSYPSVGTLTGEDYSAILLGEVSGNWVSSGSLARAKLVSKVDQSSNKGESVEISLGKLLGATGEILTIPVELKFPAGSKSVEAYQFDLVFNHLVIRPVGSGVATADTLSSGLSAVSNPNRAGRLRIAVFGASAIKSGGVLINLQFYAVGRTFTSTKLTVENLLLNEGDPVAIVNSGLVDVAPIVKFKGSKF